MERMRVEEPMKTIYFLKSLKGRGRLIDLGLPLAGFGILFVGNDYRKKGLDALFQALIRLPDQAWLAVVGNAAHIPEFRAQAQAAHGFGHLGEVDRRVEVGRFGHATGAVVVDHEGARTGLDDGIEADFALSNCRIMRNRITNCFVGISSQPGLGGPKLPGLGGLGGFNPFGGKKK